MSRIIVLGLVLLLGAPRLCAAADDKAVEKLAQALIEAKTKAERRRLLDREKNLVDTDLVFMLLKTGDDLALKEEYAAAVQHEAVALEVVERLGDKDSLAMYHGFRGNRFKYQRQWTEAVASYRKALSLFREVKDRRGEAVTLKHLGTVYHCTYQYAEALHCFQDSLAIARDLGDRAAVAVVLGDLGGLYLAMDRTTEALQHYVDSLKIVRSLGNRTTEAERINNRGEVLLDMRQYLSALTDFRESLKIYRALEDRQGEMESLTNLGFAYQLIGEYAEALQCHQGSLKIARALHDRAGEARALSGLGNVLGLTGRYTEALQYYQDSLKIKRALHQRASEAIVLNNMGTVYDKMRRYKEALQHFQDGLQIAQALGNRAVMQDSLNKIGTVYVLTNRHEEALQHFYDSLQIAQALGDRAGEATTRNNIGIVCRLMGRFAVALRLTEQALKIADAIYDVELIARCYHSIGHIHRDQKEWAQAAKAYREAIHHIERLRANTREPLLQTSYFGGNTSVYGSLAECLLELRQPGEAFAVSEQVKARTLVQLLQADKVVVRQGMTDDERRRERELLDLKTALTIQHDDLLRRKEGDKLAAKVRELERARQDYDTFRRGIYLRNADLQTRRAEFAPAALTDLNRVLFIRQPGLVIVSYLVLDTETLLFVLTRGDNTDGPATLAIHRVEIEAKQLGDAVNEFRDGCGKPGITPASDELYHWLLEPVAEPLDKAKHVVIVPDGILHTLPFHALRADETSPYLIQRCAVSYAPSVTALVKMTELADCRRKARGEDVASMLAVGVTDFAGREKKLPKAEQEAQGIAKLFGRRGQVLLGQAATQANVQQAWGTARYLHFATHGRLNEASPFYSSLVLSTGGERDDGQLFARELLDANLTAELAVLSACETARGQQVHGEGILGLSWAWFVAGVPSIVVSQWPVADDSTARLMMVFYRELNGGATKAEALRQAQLTLLKDRGTKHPFYWAPFVLIGDAGQ